MLVAIALMASGALNAAGWWLHIDPLVQPFGELAATKINAALCTFSLGVCFASISLKQRKLILVALVPLFLSGLTSLEFLFQTSIGIDEVLAADRFVFAPEQPGRMALVSALGLFFTSALLLIDYWKGTTARIRTEVVVASLVGSIGLSTLLGYLAGLPAVYAWGTSIPVAPMAAIDLTLIGLALVFHAWRESQNEKSTPPEWLQIPAIITCLTLTIILSAGLRGRETTYVSAKTQTAMDTLATTLNADLVYQINSFERLALRWSQTPDINAITMEADAEFQMRDSADYGVVSISWLNADRRTRWIYPHRGNEGSLSFDHGENATRAETIDLSIQAKRSLLSNTVEIVGHGKGVAIYSPMIRDNVMIGLVGADILYQPFFKAVANEKLKLSQDYSLSIWIGGERVYEARPNDGSNHPELALDRTYTILGRRVSLTLGPSSELLARERRYLPELALAAGFGITLLLGLSVHLARRARTGQALAEHSNKKILLENVERRRVEARLKVSDERLRLALDSTQIGIFEWNVASSHLYYSPSLWAMFGYDHDHMPATAEIWESLIHPDDVSAYRDKITHQLQGAVSFIDPEYRVRNQRGTWRWVYMRSRTVATANGLPSRIIGTVQDITDRLETLQALRLSQSETRKLSLVASKIDNPVLICSPEGLIEWVNESFTRVMEYPLQEVIGKTPADLMLGPETGEESIRQIKSAVSSGQPFAMDAPHYAKSGRRYQIYLEMQPVHNEAGQLENIIVIETDITARVETEKNLRRAKSEADDASRAKSEFLASMSHEIRTPMNGVIGMTSLLMETSLNLEQRDFVNTIRTSGETLLTVLNDILDFSKIESGKMDLEQLPFQLAPCVESTLDLFAFEASAKRIELGYHIGDEVPAWIVGDSVRLRQVMVNLVNNAVKFTSAGSVSIQVNGKEAENKDEILLEFRVQDTGIGIPQDRLDRLFKAFSQVDSSTTRKYGGTGLGLAISQRLCELMGGSIRVESEMTTGSTFIFTITAQKAAASEPILPPSTPELLIGATVLCVETNPIAQQRLRSIFNLCRAQCYFVDSIPQAVASFDTFPSKPALIVVNGDETRADHPISLLDHLTVPRLVMLPFGQLPSSHTQTHPFTSTVFKPLKTNSILYALDQLFHNSAKADVTNTQAETATLALSIPLSILVVEDNPINQKVIIRFLERLGYHPQSVDNGRDAIKLLAKQSFHLVWMDIQMPGIDGFETSREIRSTLAQEHQPKIIALTANAMQGDRDLCLAAGMDDYISKPVKLPEIISAIRRIFEKSPSLQQVDEDSRSGQNPEIRI